MKYEKKTQTGRKTETGTGAGTGTGRKTEAGREPRRPAGIRAAALAMAVLLAAAGAAVYAEGEEGSWTLGGWSRANFGWDFENETQLGKPDGDWDATGAEATLTYTKGNWKVAGTATVTTDNFGFATAAAPQPYAAGGNIQATYTVDGWEAYVKATGDFDASTQGAQFGMKKWNQADDPWGITGVVNFENFGWFPMFDLTFLPESGDNKVGLFINLWDKKVLLESGYGDYTENTVWQSPGPLETQYESVDDKDSLVRLQVKELVPGLNFGFAYLPGHLRKTLGPGYNTQADWAATPIVPDPDTAALAPIDVIRAATFGAKYASGPLTLALGGNFQINVESIYAGLSYKLLNDQLILSADGAGTALGAFDTAGVLSLGEKVVFKDDPDAQRLEIGLTLKENALAGKSGDDFEFVASPYVWYDLIEKTARVKLGFDLTQGVGDSKKDNTTWAITALFGWSLKGTPSVDPDDTGTGFAIGYKYGIEKKGSAETPTNQLYFGFKASL